MGAKMDFLVKIIRFVFGPVFKISQIGWSASYDLIKKVGVIKIITLISIFGSLWIPLTMTIDTGDPIYFTNSTASMIFKGDLDVYDSIIEMKSEDSDWERFKIGFGVLGFFGIVYWVHFIVSTINKTGASNNSLGGVINIFWTLFILTLLDVGYIILHPDSGYTMFQGFFELCNNFSFYVDSMTYPVDFIVSFKDWIFGIPLRISDWWIGLKLSFSNSYNSFLSKIPFLS